mmetsp:Transcript_25968/g.65475  ORF Transcript_25968/g.65475 Transcript_25968/m.65475 type:complete len:86 (-) Transcript_25968:924-1181(-)
MNHDPSSDHQFSLISDQGLPNTCMPSNGELNQGGDDEHSMELLGHSKKLLELLNRCMNLGKGVVQGAGGEADDVWLPHVADDACL